MVQMTSKDASNAISGVISASKAAMASQKISVF
jgi:hypothetical protein